MTPMPAGASSRFARAACGSRVSSPASAGRGTSRSRMFELRSPCGGVTATASAHRRSPTSTCAPFLTRSFAWSRGRTSCSSRGGATSSPTPPGTRRGRRIAPVHPEANLETPVQKLALAALLAVLVLGASACGSSSKSSSGTTTGGTTTSAGGGDFKVGLVTDIGGLNDRGFNHLAYVGLQKAQSDLGVQGRVVQSKSPAEYVPNLSALARQGYNLVIGVGFTEIEAMKAVSKTFPNTHFAIVDVSNADEGNAKNVEGLLFKEQEVGYLAGYAAALAAKDKGANAVSSVGGQKQPPVDRYIAGYQAGAKAAVPGIKTLNNYSQDFANQAKCKEIALNQIAAGSAVVFQVAGGCGLGALDAAKAKNVWGIGVDADQAFLGPHILTSALKGVDRAVFLSIKDAESGHFKGGQDAVYGLDQEGVGLGKFSAKAPEGLEAKVKKIQQQITSGAIKNIPTTVQ